MLLDEYWVASEGRGTTGLELAHSLHVEHFCPRVSAYLATYRASGGILSYGVGASIWAVLSGALRRSHESSRRLCDPGVTGRSTA